MGQSSNRLSWDEAAHDLEFLNGIQKNIWKKCNQRIKSLSKSRVNYSQKLEFLVSSLIKFLSEELTQEEKVGLMTFLAVVLEDQQAYHSIESQEFTRTQQQIKRIFSQVIELTPDSERQKGKQKKDEVKKTLARYFLLKRQRNSEKNADNLDFTVRKNKVQTEQVKDKLYLLIVGDIQDKIKEIEGEELKFSSSSRDDVDTRNSFSLYLDLAFTMQNAIESLRFIKLLEEVEKDIGNRDMDNLNKKMSLLLDLSIKKTQAILSNFSTDYFVDISLDYIKSFYEEDLKSFYENVLDSGKFSEQASAIKSSFAFIKKIINKKENTQDLATLRKAIEAILTEQSSGSVSNNLGKKLQFG